MTRAVVIGGGHGASASLRACLEFASEVSGVISVADDGGSSGRLAKELGVLPMGDIRNCLAALASNDSAADVFQHRFATGSLEGHVLGNLIVAAVAEMTGSFIAGVDQLAALLKSRGRVVPPTLERVTLGCEARGRRIEGQVAVATATDITRLFLTPPSPKAFPEAADLIGAADVVVLGPGSLFTSVLPPLLVPGILEAFNSAKARKVYVCNLAAPSGETAGFDARSHLDALHRHLSGGQMDTMIVHEGEIPRLEAPPVSTGAERLRDSGVEVVGADLIPDTRAPRHDPARLATALRLAVGAP